VAIGVGILCQNAVVIASDAQVGDADLKTGQFKLASASKFGIAGDRSELVVAGATNNLTYLQRMQGDIVKLTHLQDLDIHAQAPPSASRSTAIATATPFGARPAMATPLFVACDVASATMLKISPTPANGILNQFNVPRHGTATCKPAMRESRSRRGMELTARSRCPTPGGLRECSKRAP